MTTTPATKLPQPTVTIEEGEQMAFGHPGLVHRPPLGTILNVRVTDGDFARQWEFVRFGDGQMRETCDKCGLYGRGFIEHYAGLHGGQCYRCRGIGVGRKVGDAAEIEKIVTRRFKAARTAARKAAAKAAEAATEYEAWAAEHADLLAELAAYEGTHGLLLDLAYRAKSRALTGPQIQVAREVMARESAEAARQRFAGEQGEKITISGTVKVTTSVENDWGWSRLVIIEGADADDGITVKIVSTAAAVYELEQGHAVTVTGTVKQHHVYDGTKQTQIIRPKFAA